MSAKKGNGTGRGKGSNGQGSVAPRTQADEQRRHSVLPPPPPKFNGVIGRTYKDSTMGEFPVMKAPDLSLIHI